MWFDFHSGVHCMNIWFMLISSKFKTIFVWFAIEYLKRGLSLTILIIWIHATKILWKRERPCVIQGIRLCTFNRLMVLHSCRSCWEILCGVSQKCIAFCFHPFEFRLRPPFIFWTHLAKCNVRANFPTVTSFNFRFIFDMSVLIYWQCLITLTRLFTVPWILRNPWFKQVFLDRVRSFIHNFTLCKLLHAVVLLWLWIESGWFQF